MINKHKSNKIKENSNTVRHLNNGTDHRHSKSRCDQSSPARRTITPFSECVMIVCYYSWQTHIHIDNLYSNVWNIWKVPFMVKDVIFTWLSWQPINKENIFWAIFHPDAQGNRLLITLSLCCIFFSISPVKQAFFFGMAYLLNGCFSMAWPWIMCRAYLFEQFFP